MLCPDCGTWMNLVGSMYSGGEQLVVTQHNWACPECHRRVDDRQETEIDRPVSWHKTWIGLAVGALSV